MTASLSIRQVAQYPRQTSAPAGSVALLQLGELGSPYASIAASDLVATALASGGVLQLDPTAGAISFGQGPDAPTIDIADNEFLLTAPLSVSSIETGAIDAQSITQAGVPLVTQAKLDALPIVSSFNSRTGDVQLELPDILRAGGAPIRDAHFGGWITAPSIWDSRANDDTVATTNWVHRAIHDTGVSSFMGRTGCITLTTSDVNAAYAVPGVYPMAPSPALGDASGRIATTLFVDESLQDLHMTISDEQLALLMSTYAPLHSPQLTGMPTAPTAATGTQTGQLATTAFVMNAIQASTTGVVSFNTRTGMVVLNSADITSAGGALLNSPTLTGTPSAPTAAPGTNSTVLATTAFVQAAMTAATAGVASFNGRTGAVTLTLADVTATNVLNNTPLIGVPTAPTAAPGTSTTQLATTAFVAAYGVSSFMSRTGAVTLQGADISAAGGALLAGPAFTGAPTAPTAAPGTNSTQLATTAFVTAALAATGVTSFNGRAGAVTLTAADITGTGPTLQINSPAGTPAQYILNKTTDTQSNVIWGYRAGLQRWAVILGDGTPEGGGNAGSNFAIYNYADTGAGLSITPFLISRATGVTYMAKVGVGNNTLPGGQPGTWGSVMADGYSVAYGAGHSIGFNTYWDPTISANRYMAAGYGNALYQDTNGAINFAMFGSGAAGAQPTVQSASYTFGNTGGLTVNSFTSNASLILSKGASGVACALVGDTNGTLRWQLHIGNANAESGSNAGSDFTVYRYTDAGALLDAPLNINRANGVVSIGSLINTGVDTANAAVNIRDSGVKLGIYVRATLAGGGNNAIVFANTAGTTVGSIQHNDTATSYVTTSDGRFKTDLREFEAGAIIDRLTPWDFRWKANGHRGHGLVAQEAIEFYPEAVSHDDDTDIWGIDYSKFVPLLIAEIKALRARVAELEALGWG